MVKVRCIEELKWGKGALTAGKIYEKTSDRTGTYQGVGDILVTDNYGELAAYPECIFEYIEN